MRFDSHPEDLIDRARLGTLDRAGQTALDRHLALCSACAAHLSMAPQFESEAAPQPRDALLDQRAIAAAMVRLQSSPAARRRTLPPWFRWAAAAALLAFAVTGAAAVIGRRRVTHPVLQSLPPAVETPPLIAPPRPVEIVPPEAPPVAEAPTAKVNASKRAPNHPVVTASMLFERAETQRREGHGDAAIATYRRLQATFPETAEARLSFALAGQYLLKHGRPSDALVQFDRHLKAGGEVGEEALAGRATAFEQLHRTPEAIGAWKDLLARHPGSVYAERARARLTELTQHP